MPNGKYLKQEGDVIYPYTLAQNVLNEENGNPINLSSSTTLTKTVSGLGSFTFNFYKYNKFVFVTLRFVTNSTYTTGWSDVYASGSVPSAYRPIDTVNVAICRENSGTHGEGLLQIFNDGTIRYGRNVAGTSGVVMGCSAMYLTD